MHDSFATTISFYLINPSFVFIWSSSVIISETNFEFLSISEAICYFIGLRKNTLRWIFFVLPSAFHWLFDVYRFIQSVYQCTCLVFLNIFGNHLSFSWANQFKFIFCLLSWFVYWDLCWNLSISPKVLLVCSSTTSFQLKFCFWMRLSPQLPADK